MTEGRAGGRAGDHSTCERASADVRETAYTSQLKLRASGLHMRTDRSEALRTHFKNKPKIIDSSTTPSLGWLSVFPLSQTLSKLSSFPLPPSRTGTVSLPWLGGCNLLQAAGQAERSPSYLDRGSPGKSYQREGVFKYSRNCSNHFLLSLQPPLLHLLHRFIKRPNPPLTFSPSDRHPPPPLSPIPRRFFPPLAFLNSLPSSPVFPPLVSS